MKTLTCIVAAAVLAGCASTQTTPPTYAGCLTWDRQAQQEGLDGVAVLSPELSRVIGVREVLTSRTGTGMTAVQTTVHNCSDVDVVLSVRSRFSGERGQSEPPSAWKTVFLPPRGQVVYGESAVSQATRRIAVDIHDANRGQSQFAPGQTYQIYRAAPPAR